MLTIPSTYIGYVNGASHSSQNIAYAAWVIFSSTNEFVGSEGIFLGLATNNFVEYEVVIALLSATSTLGICHLVLWLDS